MLSVPTTLPPTSIIIRRHVTYIFFLIIIITNISINSLSIIRGLILSFEEKKYLPNAFVIFPNSSHFVHSFLSRQNSIVNFENSIL